MMKLKNSRDLLILILFFALVIFIEVEIRLDEDIYNGDSAFIYHPIEEYKISKSWNLTGTTIQIDERTTNDWAFFATTEEWCNGSGTLNDPYIIENVTVDKILIYWSSKHFIIRNCKTVLSLDRTDNGIIINNTYSNTDSEGVLILYSEYNILTNNTISNNWANGIRLIGSSYIQILNNQLFENGIGVKLDSSSNRNEITRNNIHDNLDYGLRIENCDYNIIYKNNFVKNRVNAYDEFGFNNWDNGTIGNYWDDYTGKDANDNGIGDTPFIIPGSENNKDNYPIYDDGPERPFSFPLEIVITIIAFLSISGALIYNKKRISNKRSQGIIKKRYVSKDIEKINKIKKHILEMSTRFTRVELAEIIELTEVKDKNIISQTIMNMINNKEVYAQYFSSSKAIVFDQQANINEIDNLMKIYQKWEAESIGKI